MDHVGLILARLFLTLGNTLQSPASRMPPASLPTLLLPVLGPAVTSAPLWPELHRHRPSEAPPLRVRPVFEKITKNIDAFFKLQLSLRGQPSPGGTGDGREVLLHQLYLVQVHALKVEQSWDADI